MSPVLGFFARLPYHSLLRAGAPPKGMTIETEPSVAFVPSPDSLSLARSADFVRTPGVAVLSFHASPLAALGSDENGGMNVYVREGCGALMRRGIPTDIFTRRTDPEQPDAVPIGPGSWLAHITAGPAAPLGKHELPRHVAAFQEGVLAHARARETRYAALHSHYWLSGWVAHGVAQQWEVPWFHTAHTLGRVKNAHAAEGAVLESEQRIQKEEAIVRRCDVLIASTDAEAEDLMRLYGAPAAKVKVVPPGVDGRRFHPRRTAALRRRLGLQGQRVVLYAGRLERLKGVETLLKAFALLPEVRSPWAAPARLLVVGGDSTNGALESRAHAGERRRLMLRARDLGIAEAVQFLGPVGHDALPEYYSLADVCVMPSFTESFGLVALEAQACGTPVVASRVGGLALLVKDGVTGFTVPDHSAHEFAGRIAHLLDSRALRRELGRRGRLLAQSYTWERTGERLAGLYASRTIALEPGSQRLVRSH